MTWRKRTIMEMAREAGICTWLKPPVDVVERIERFAELVREDEAEKYKLDVHSCGPTCTKVACVATRAAVQAEREACAMVCEQGLAIATSLSALDDMEIWGEKFAAAIRARGDKHDKLLRVLQAPCFHDINQM